MDQARVKLEGSRDAAKRDNLERCNALLQQQQDSLNARWSSCYGELQKNGESVAKKYQKALKELEDANLKIQELTARELHQTLDRQNDDIVAQDTKAVLVMKEQRIAELEAIEKDMAGQLKDEKARHESLKLQHAMLEADYAEVVDIASSLTEGPDGTALAEFFDRHRTLEQQVRELRAENEAQAEHPRAAAGSKEQGAESTGDEGRGKRRKRAT
ncbi:hypothetical protein B0T11DRAFT_225622 [Plectosphaerella cucumerina]|uniref:Uncharacterized protein n=1 Tax=Plectosphaerella cucumerina TaxID=40658 RepID=A0A8K0X4A1_9PEZI|nr:hypothetical protein B0T11DRAFT_225622 [Plectosphaerella cucumerina]